MVVMAEQGIDDKKAQVHLCRENVQVEVAGKASHQHTLYDWGATVNLCNSCRCQKGRTGAGEATHLSDTWAERRVHNG